MVRIMVGDVLEQLALLPESSVHCVVTSPPYWALRDYGVEGQLGRERTPEEYVARMVEVFREVRRVLRPDGTLWLNIGDTWASSGGSGKQGSTSQRIGRSNVEAQERPGGCRPPKGLKAKDLVGVPWMLAFALRADGWWLRDEIIWQKRNPMPSSNRDRTTRGHEQVFLLSKSARYFFDDEGSSETASGRDPGNRRHKHAERYAAGHEDSRTKAGLTAVAAVERRRMRSVWSLSSEPFKGAHFATFPTRLVEKCLKAGISIDGVCPACGAPRERVLDRQRVATRPGMNTKVKLPAGWDLGLGAHGTIHRKGRASAHEQSPQSGSVVGNRDPYRHITRTVTVCWRATCEHEMVGPAAPAVVLDPFCGAGTTLLVARRMGAVGIGIELNPEYAEMARRRIEQDAPLFAAST